MNAPVQLAFLLVSQFEGFRATAYLDQGGRPTIGFGRADTSVKLGQTSTVETETEWTKQRLAWLWQRLDHDLGRDLNVNQAAALLSLVYNVGLGALQRSHMWQMLQDGQWEPAATRFLDFCKVRLPSGALTTDAGLIKRRQAEKALFLADPPKLLA